MSDRTTYAWAAPYAGLDDDALKALGNAGLLRRARKDTVTEVSHDAKGAVLDVSGVTVRVDGRGPAAVACDCPTAGVCQHVLTACLWATGVAPDVPAGAAASGAATSDPGASGAAASGAASSGTAGSGSAPVVAQSVPRAGGGVAGGAAGSGVPGEPGTTAARPPSPAVLKRRREVLAEVRDVVGRLMSGGLSHLGADDAESLTALAGRVRVAGFDQVASDQVGNVRFHSLVKVTGGLVAGLAGRDDAVTESDLLDTLAEVWAMCEVLERATDPTVDGTMPGGSTQAAADRAASANGPGSDNSAGLLADPAKPGSANRSAPAVVGGSASSGPGRGAGSGKAGKGADDEVDVPRWVPLGARWWTSQSGSRGLAYLGWDAETEAGASSVPGSGQVRQLVTGRPSGTDPRFQRSWTSPLLWNRSLSTLCEGAFALTKVRTKPDGGLGAGGTPVLQRLEGDGFDLEELRVIAERTGAGVQPRDVVGFGRRPANVRLVLVRDVGEVGIDEVRQELTLSVVTSDGETRLLRLPVSGEQAVQTLLSVRSKLVAVTIERREDRDEPVGLFVRDKSAIRLVSPTITPPWSLETTYWDFWRRRLKKLKAQASSAKTVRPPAAPPSPVRRVTLLLGDVLLAAAATGRPALTTRQRSDVEQARVLARDLGLATLERTAQELLAGDLTPPAVLHAAFVVGRARAVADVAS
ncbi:hypothetical protein GCM10010413_15960 [Promicromonospora sukumoe]|uniref:SWIM-type domain-containing protein n=1 Tax=Promicromonospora sukumoe TaxID=88382 RepID=A0A7W3JAA5_9MICO|nr:hypothetical protein [Promicromonospora sukumoe]MBA8809181.1 hypothetical protein [Promicromonospora sukumoe]